MRPIVVFVVSLGVLCLVVAVCFMFVLGVPVFTNVATTTEMASGLRTVTMEVYVFLGLVTVIPAIVLTLLIRAVFGKKWQISDEEIRMVQELHQGFSKLGDRLESLETLMLDHVGSDRKRH